MSQLNILAQHRDILLLAEAIGWLHDYRKCSDEHLKVQAANPQGSALPRSEANDPNSLSSKYPPLTNVNLQLLSCIRSVTNLLNDNTWNTNTLGQFLRRCHRTGHFDKQEPVGGRQCYPGTRISTAFGFEKHIPNKLTQKLWNLPWDKLADYSSVEQKELREYVSDLFSQIIADTRRPINEVDLWSWGLLVGALYKSVLAGALLEGSTPAARDLRWRLLDIRVNGLDYLLNVARIPDLLARKALLAESLDRVQKLLEVTYPLGSEVYRDENGSVYVVPDVPDLLERANSSGETLQTLILQAFAQGTLKGNDNLQLGGEMVPNLELEQPPWWGQDADYLDKTQPGRSSRLYGQPVQNEFPKIGELLSRQVWSQAKLDEIDHFWRSGKIADICTVCGLRPQGPGKKAADRNVCDICEKRRADRSQAWATSQSDKTIWTDEVADTNGRLALIVGKFDLTHWLDGSMLESLLLIAPHDPENKNGLPVTSKTPSFSRLRRIWETTRLFWREGQDEILKQLTDDRRRLKVYLDSTPDLGPYHVYDLLLGVTNLSVVWLPPNGDDAGYLHRVA